MQTRTNRSAVEVLADRMREAYNAHDPGAVAAIFAAQASLRDQAWEEIFEGSAAIRERFAAEFVASPDIRLEEEHRYVSEDAVVTEGVVRGTHGGTWRGMPATGNTFEVTVWTAIRADDTGTRIADLRLYYDRARVLTQIGMLHDVETTLGKTMAVLTHPVTMARAARKRLSERPAPRA